MRVVVIGGSGLLGSLIVPALSATRSVTIADRCLPTYTHAPYLEVNVLDHASIARVCHGHDALVYLAMGPKSAWGTPEWAGGQFDVNVKGLYFTLQAAAAGGVRRVVFASSASVLTPYLGRDIGDPPDAVDGYGLSKGLGEAVCAAASREHGLTIIALRLVAPKTDTEWVADTGQFRDVSTAGSDVADCFARALDAPLTGYHCLPVSGDVTGRHIDISATTAALGWAPRARPEE